jgi:hypothetical protein
MVAPYLVVVEVFIEGTFKFCCSKVSAVYNPLNIFKVAKAFNLDRIMFILTLSGDAIIFF